MRWSAAIGESVGQPHQPDQQDPESSRAWQLHRSQQLIEPHGGVLVAEYFDCGHSRSLPWQRRPAATACWRRSGIPTAASLV
jgi:site-specific DNA recombinase